jgi:hypothetical protein
VVGNKGQIIESSRIRHLEIYKDGSLREDEEGVARGTTVVPASCTITEY